MGRPLARASVFRSAFLFFYSLCILIIAATPSLALDLTVKGVNKDGSETVLTDYRWLIEEDTTYHSPPGVSDPDPLAFNFHSSYMPVVAEGKTADPDGIDLSTLALDPSKHYFISVLPTEPGTYTIGGGQIAPGQTAVTVHLNQLPLPTAQITVFVFEDTHPINNAPDLPAERGLEGFQLVLEDAGGRYGMSAGFQMMDAFGNPLGTTYNPDGSVATMGDGIILTDAEGRAVIKNLAPGKYGVIAVPPAGQGWAQTSTIEGTKLIDAWVKANEPPFFAEFGPPGQHVAFGFVKEMNDATVLSGGSTISGQVVNLHLSRPPDSAFYNGAPFGHTTPWVGLNLGPQGRGVYVKRCNEDGTFAIPNVPPGDYQLVIWDDNLDLLFAFKNVTVGITDVHLGDVPVFQWFTRLENYVFNDLDGDGFRDEGEPGIPEQAVNLRWRDGTMYQSFPTDGEGAAPFDEVFPFFSWLVAEVDFARFKATGATITVDDGGPIDMNDPWTARFEGVLNPQPQPENGGLPYRTELGPVLTEAFQGFLGQTSVIEWGKAAYGPGENGGISGMVFYATTRAEDDPRYAAAEPWEPGIPGVRVNLYDATGMVLLNTTTTDSWDASVPTGCPDDPNETVQTFLDLDCYDGMRNWNQVRPGVFDGGYAFEEYYPGGIQTNVDGSPMLDENGEPVPVVAGEAAAALVSAEYVVEVIPPPGYQLVKEEDRNVDFGDDYEPSPLLLPPVCIGDPHLVPDELSLFPGVPASFANTERPLCDRKLVALADGRNAAADFFLFTYTPIAGHIVGFILDDTANEFDPTSPQFGEKYGPPWLPVAIRDWTGREIGRVYSDEHGRYNALVPSTYTTNQPNPSGMSPNMLTTCMNDPVLPDGTPDPYFNPQYSTFCYTFQYMPGATTYLDTPVVPVAAFAGPGQYPLDCEYPSGTPKIASVSVANGTVGGPYVTAAGQVITIESEGMVSVANPAYDGSNDPVVERDYTFGSGGTVSIGGVPLTDVAWTPETITATVPAEVTTGQLEITRADTGEATINGLTVTVRQKQDKYNVVAVPPGGSIQAAIDAAEPGDLVLVPPGTYNEMVIMWKPVQLQGAGAGTTLISALKTPPEKLVAWRDKVQFLIETNQVDLLPGQEIGFGGLEPVTLFTEEGAGLLVLAAGKGKSAFDKADPAPRFDGFTVTGADTGGGIVVNGYGDNLAIGNNRIINNSGFYGGGIRVGHPELLLEQGNNVSYQDADNDNIRIHDNHITRNGGLGGAGGGVSLCTGSDGYRVTGNYVCGNFSLGDGGGIGHLGLSQGGLIAGNTVLFNESFNQGRTIHGGGLFIGGAPALPGEALGTGSGSVVVKDNVLQGNSAGAGDGGGIALVRINGRDVADNSQKPEKWHTVSLFNNMIVNNVAGLAGGGIVLQDAVQTPIIHNTVANNDSTATAGQAFSPDNPNQSLPQPAGIVARAHDPALGAVLPAGAPGFSDPVLADNIVMHNRSFYFSGDPAADQPVYQLWPDVEAGEAPVYYDLAVLGVTGSLTCDACLLTGDGDPMFVAEYVNGNRGVTVTLPESTTAIQAPPAFDEGGNFIKVRFGPLTPTRPDGTSFGDYHLQAGSAAIEAGTNLNSTYPDLMWDCDAEARPYGSQVDIGADELWP